MFLQFEIAFNDYQTEEEEANFPDLIKKLINRG